MPSRVRVATPEEEKAFESHGGGGGSMVRVATPEEEQAFQAANDSRATGGGSPDNAERPGIPKDAGMKLGTAKDAIKSLGNAAALGAAPQIEGVMGAIANAATQGFYSDKPTSDLEAYRAVRDQGIAEHAASDDTYLGKVGGAVGTLATPIPFKPAKGAGVVKRGLQAGGIGAGTGFVSGAAESKGDITKGEWGKVIGDALSRVPGGAVGGFVAGAGLAAAEKPLRSTARRLPMDMLGVSEPARRSMQRQGIYDEAGDDLLSLVRPFRSGMRQGSLTEDAVAEASKRGAGVGRAVADVDAVSGGATADPKLLAAEIRKLMAPFKRGSLQDKQVAGRMEGEAKNLGKSMGSQPVSLADAEAFKQRFGPAVSKQLRHAGEPAAKTDALAEVYRALKGANEKAAESVSPSLAKKFVESKKSYQRMAAPLEGAKVDRSGLQSSDFDWGDALAAPPPTQNAFTKAVESIPLAGPLVTGGLNLAGRAYGRGVAANLAEFGANRAAKNTGGVVGEKGANALAEYLGLLEEFE